MNTETLVGENTSTRTAFQEWSVYIATHPSAPLRYVGATYHDLEKYLTSSPEMKALVKETGIRPTFEVVLSGISDRNSRVDSQTPFKHERDLYLKLSKTETLFNVTAPSGRCSWAYLPSAKQATDKASATRLITQPWTNPDQVAAIERQMENKIGIFSQTYEEKVELARKGAASAMANGTNTFAFVKITCECGMVGNKPNMNRHAKASGHELKKEQTL
jgi:hypothetical protein